MDCHDAQRKLFISNEVEQPKYVNDLLDALPPLPTECAGDIFIGRDYKRKENIIIIRVPDGDGTQFWKAGHILNEKLHELYHKLDRELRERN